METILTVSGFGLVIIFQAASTAYLMGKMKAMINGTIQDVRDLKKDGKVLHTRMTDHLKDFHTKKKG